MISLGKKRLASRHRLQDAGLSLLAQRTLVDPFPAGHHADQRFAAMGVQVIHDEDPACLWIGLDRVLNVPGEVLFGACDADRGRDHLPQRDMPVADQAQRAIPLVFTAGGQKRREARDA